VDWAALTPSDEIEAADWIGPRLHPFAQDVGSVVPSGFEAYARIFHPAGRLAGAHQVEMRWSDVAAWTGRVVHPEMQFHSIAAPLPGRETRVRGFNAEPWLGALSEGQARALVEVLARHTSIPDTCWFGVWEGYGTFKTRPKWKRVSLPHRNYFLFRGPLSLAPGHLDGPNLWWPDDRSWCVASEIDFPYTYVGGSKKLIDEILADPNLEALPAALDDGITAFSDTVNQSGFVGFEE
jgi:hypothetical protein